MYLLLIPELSILPAVCLNCFIFCLELTENNVLNNILKLVFVMMTECVCYEAFNFHDSDVWFFHCGMIPDLWWLGYIATHMN
jgi:hypothetical protein